MFEHTGRRVVWSGDSEGATSTRYCPRCGRPAHMGRCAPTTPGGAGRGGADIANAQRARGRDDVVRVWLDRKGRRGKAVSVIAGLPGDAAALAEMAQSLKKLLGSGGTARDGQVEIQGDHVERLIAHFGTLGYAVKRVGG
ncbi:MAG TPA: stress response translation initiation inhibitor YciH [Ktedonobacterales bacterium]|jgi:translation initiation factor 1